ncbi:MAG: replicative DNA helicase [Alphaproteobacteria bacterium]|nr:replicative DNA helicase [Alphaproteobacteria bacterium]
MNSPSSGTLDLPFSQDVIFPWDVTYGTVERIDVESTKEAAVANGLSRTNNSTSRFLPCNIEAEKALLAAILIDNRAYFPVMDFLRGEHFYDNYNRLVYETAERLIRDARTATPVTLKTFMRDEIDPARTEQEAQQYMAALVANAASIINAEEYGRSIYELATLRNLILIGEKTVNTAYNPSIEISPKEQIENVEKELYALAETERYGEGFRSFENALSHSIDMAAAAYQREGYLAGIASGFRDLDRLTGGLQASDLIIMAGRPSMGKTALATNIAYHVASQFDPLSNDKDVTDARGGGRVGFFSLEMSAEQLATRIISEQIDLPSNKIRRGQFDQQDFTRLQGFAAQMQHIPLFIDQTGGISIAQLSARARRLKREHGLDLIIVDYLQLLSGTQRGPENRVQEISQITNGLKALAKTLNVPIIALSQLSRQVEQRPDKRPQLSDLRDSGAIEQDADVVLFIFRQEYYHARHEPESGTVEHLEWEQEQAKLENLAEVIVAKQRHGPIGTIKLHFHGATTRFSDLAEGDYLPDYN